MTTAKIAITLDGSLLGKIDRLVRRKIYPNRSKAIQDAVAEKMMRLNRTRLSRECDKLDPASEQKLADKGLKTDLEQWPEY